MGHSLKNQKEGEIFWNFRPSNYYIMDDRNIVKNNGILLKFLLKFKIAKLYVTLYFSHSVFSAEFPAFVYKIIKSRNSKISIVDPFTTSQIKP